MANQKKSALPFHKLNYDKDLDVPELKHPIKTIQWFLSVPDCEILYILATYESMKGKYLYKCGKEGKVFRLH
jgi:hypothetical protein